MPERCYIQVAVYIPVYHACNECMHACIHMHSRVWLTDLAVHTGDDEDVLHQYTVSCTPGAGNCKIKQLPTCPKADAFAGSELSFVLDLDEAGWCNALLSWRCFRAVCDSKWRSSISSH